MNGDRQSLRRLRLLLRDGQVHQRDVLPLHRRLQRIALLEADKTLAVVNQQPKALQKVSSQHAAHSRVRHSDLAQILNHGHHLLHDLGTCLNRIKRCKRSSCVVPHSDDSGCAFNLQIQRLCQCRINCRDLSSGVAQIPREDSPAAG
jgi:hypothetical protein